MINKNNVLPLVLAFCVGAILSILGLRLSQRMMPAPILIAPQPPLPTPLPTATPGPIRIFVNGEVGQPGVYELPPNSILEQAISAAGGFKGEAQTAVINLAQPLQDGMQIYVPSVSETAVAPIVSEPEAIDSGPEPSGGLVDINAATVEELDTLPGIGPAIAQAIVEFREGSGLFLNIEEILLVSGIGEAKFGQIEALITVGD